MFARLFPRGCSALTVFVSYASEQRRMGEEIAQALKNAGHTVFFDLDSIPAAGDFNQRIHDAILDADRMVFLASRTSITPGKFTLTELKFARERWPSPEGKVFPVIVDDTLVPSDLPVYLRSVSVMRVVGNATAEVVAAVQKSRNVGLLCRTVTGLAAAAMLVGAVIGLRPPATSSAMDIALLTPQKIHFRSQVEAPLKPDAPGANGAWVDSPMTVTVMPVAFAHRTEPGRKVRILQETVDLALAGAVSSYRALYVVEITDAPCGERWYCIKANAGPETLEPGRSISRETMFFQPAVATAIKWGAFVDDVLTKPDLPLQVTYRAQVEIPDGAGLKTVEMARACNIDSRQMRADLEAAKFRPGDSIRPVFLEPECQPVAVPATAAVAAPNKK